jgi:hypothetical protein
MKRILLGSTALVAAGLAATEAADAADGVKLGIGGRYMGAMGVLAIDDFSASPDPSHDLRAYVFKQDVRVYFEGSTTLDNGLTVGARIDLRGQTDTSDQIRDVYAYFNGGFGSVRFGDTEEALAQMCYLVPSASAIFGADSPNFNFSNAGVIGFGATNGTCYGVDSHSTKIVYFSPTFAGFSFATSFTPDNAEDTRNTVNGAATRPDNDLGQNSENLSVAANFNHDFNGVKLIVGGGGTWSFQREQAAPPPGASSPGDRQEYNGYAQVAFSGFTVGGAVSDRVNVSNSIDNTDDVVYGAGATYNWEAWTVGLGWTRGNYDNIHGVGTTDKHDIVSFTSAYALGPGIELDGLVEYDKYAGAGAGDSYEGLGFGLGTLITF